MLVVLGKDAFCHFVLLSASAGYSTYATYIFPIAREYQKLAQQDVGKSQCEENHALRSLLLQLACPVSLSAETRMVFLAKYPIVFSPGPATKCVIKGKSDVSMINTGWICYFGPQSFRI